MSDVVALDLGSATVGVAVGDRETRLAFPRPSIERTSDSQLLQEISELVRSEQAQAVVVGHPLTFAGTASDQTRWVEDFVQKLQEQVSVPVHLVDERLTSVAARRTNPGTGEHSEAARLLLESYLARP